MRKLLVSVIIPTFNRADELCKAVESVLNQTYPHIELIVVDDGSTDDTALRLRVYEPRLSVLRQNNKGPSVARNLGIANSRGDIVMFLDSDDLWLPAKVARQMDILERVGSDVPCCICNAIMRDSLGRTVLSFEKAPVKPCCAEGVWHNVTEVLSTRCLFFTQAAAVRRETMVKVHGFDTALDVMEDYDLAVRLSLEGPWAFIREPLVVYHSGTRNSLADEARRDQLRLYHSIETILLNILADKRLGDSNVRRNFMRWQQRNRQQIQMAMFQRNGRCLEPTTGVLQRFCTCVKEGVFRRSPWFPKMEVTPLD